MWELPSYSQSQEAFTVSTKEVLPWYMPRCVLICATKVHTQRCVYEINMEGKARAMSELSRTDIVVTRSGADEAKKKLSALFLKVHALFWLIIYL